MGVQFPPGFSYAPEPSVQRLSGVLMRWFLSASSLRSRVQRSRFHSRHCFRRWQSILTCRSSPILRPARRAESARVAPREHRSRAAFTFVSGVVVSRALYFYGRTQPGLITQAAVLTIGTFGVLTLYAFVSRRDFSAWGSFFFTGLFVLIGTIILNIYFKNPAMDLWLAGITVFVFSGLLIFDTWKIRNVYGPDEYVQAAVNIYLDLLNLFHGNSSSTRRTAELIHRARTLAPRLQSLVRDPDLSA